MITRQTVMKKLFSIVEKHNQRPAAVDKALEVFNSLAPGKHPMNKSVPTIDTSVQDARREQLQAKQDRETNGDTVPKPKAPPIRKQVTVQAESKTFPEIKIIQWANGAIAVRPADATAETVANYSPEQQEELLQLALNYLSKQKVAKSAHDAAVTKALQELDQLQKASKPPSKSTATKFPRMLLKLISKIQTSEQKPVKQVKPAIIQKETPPMTQTKPQPPEQPRTPWGCMPTLRDIATRRQSAQSPAIKSFVPIDPKAPRMTVQEQQEFRLQQAREKAAARKPVSDKSKTASWL